MDPSREGHCVPCRGRQQLATGVRAQHRSLVPRVREERRLARGARFIDEPGLPSLRHVTTDLDHDRRKTGDALLLRDEVAHDHLSAARLLGAADDRDLPPVLPRTLELLIHRTLPAANPTPAPAPP